jgi:hypothetical protein
LNKGGKDMDKYPLLRKSLAVCIILLFVAMTFSPIINAQNNIIVSKSFSIPEKEDTVSITVLEYKPDGTIGKSVVKMSPEQVVKLREELRNVKDLDTRLSIYKKYNLIPQNVTADTLRFGMEERAQRIYPEIERLQKLIANSDGSHFLLNFNCRVDGYMAYGLRFLGGLSLITCILNGFNPYYGPLLPSIDLFQLLLGIGGQFDTYNGTLPDCYSTGTFYAIFLLGFVGYFLKVTPVPNIFITRMCIFFGYSVAALCFAYAPYYSP